MSTSARTPPLRLLACTTLQAGHVSVGKESPSSKSRVLEHFQRASVCTLQQHQQIRGELTASVGEVTKGSAYEQILIRKFF